MHSAGPPFFPPAFTLHTLDHGKASSSPQLHDVAEMMLKFPCFICLIIFFLAVTQVLIKSLRELAESGGSNLVTIEKYVRQSFAGAAEVNLPKLLRVAAQKAVTKV